MPAADGSGDSGLPGAPARWLVALSVMFGAILSVMDVSIVNVALPHMMGSFAKTLSEITWVATAYSIAEIIMATMAGWWSTVLGRKRLYIGSFLLFTGGSILAGTSTSFSQMLVYRTLQGIGGGALIPVSMAILRETFPPAEQGMAMGIYGMGVVLAPAMGPVVGGWLTDTWGWPWIFYVNVPFAIVGIPMVAWFVHDPPYLRRGIRQIDWAGIVALTVGLTSLQIILERGQEHDWFASGQITAGALVAFVSLAFLVVWERRVREPVIDVRLLGNRALGTGSLLGFLFGIVLYGSTFLLPAFLQTILGYSAYDAGITLLPRALTILCLMPVAGWLYNRVDPRVLVGLGVLLVFWGFRDLAHLFPRVPQSHLWPIMIVMGLGMPFQFVTVTTLAVSTMPREHMTQASSLYTLSRRVGGNVGYALLATVVERRLQLHHARLVEHVTLDSVGGPGAMLNSMLIRQGVAPASSDAVAISLIDRLVNLQAAVMAYNDAAWFVGIGFLLSLPLLALLPGRGPLSDHDGGGR